MFDDRLRNARQRLGYTQRQVAEKAQINIASYSAYENDKSIPPLDIALRIADALEVSLESLCGKKETSNKIGSLGDIARCIVELEDSTCSCKINAESDPSIYGTGERVVVEIKDKQLYEFFAKRQRLVQMVNGDDLALKEMFDTWQKSEFKRLDAIQSESFLPF